MRLAGNVDYNPAGAIIVNAFQAQLAAARLAIASLVTVIHPSQYSLEELAIFRFPLPTKEKTKLANWLAKTGGIGRKAYGLESESMPRERLNGLVTKLILAE